MIAFLTCVMSGGALKTRGTLRVCQLICGASVCGVLWYACGVLPCVGLFYFIYFVVVIKSNK